MGQEGVKLGESSASGQGHQCWHQGAGVGEGIGVRVTQASSSKARSQKLACIEGMIFVFNPIPSLNI